ncbi:MAG: DNA recombination/repair protein RecA, partial [Bosea sp. (in: a-proteobacteria)]|nr:DNA recombination/repair protein RecA [Bosea sp. (in: a-proteobacteria)]
AFLKSNPDLAAKIEATIRQNSGLVAERILEQATPSDDDLDEGEA